MGRRLADGRGGGGAARENRGRRAGKAVNREFNEGGSRERKAKWYFLSFIKS